MLREQIDHDLLDAVLDDLAKWPMNVATIAAGALRSGLGSASYGHARASSGWLAVEDSCPDAWYSLAAELEKVRNNILPDCQQISCGQLTIDRNIAATRGRGVARAPGPAFWRDCGSSSRYEDLSLCTGICVNHCLQIFEASNLTDHQTNSRKNEQKVLSWRQEEMAHRRQFRHRHLQSHDVTDFG